LSAHLTAIIAINTSILLVCTWIFGLYFIRKIYMKKEALAEALKRTSAPADANNTDLYSMIEHMRDEIQEKEASIVSLMTEADDPANAAMIHTLQEDLKSSQKTLANMEKDVLTGQSLGARISYLEQAEHHLRNENQHMLTTQMQIAETLDKRNQQINHLKETNNKLKQTINTLTHASEEQMAIIKRLQDQINRAEELENYQRKLISNLEKQLNNSKSENIEDQDQQEINAIETELTELRDTLKRTLIEKEFIEGHLLELDDSLEKAKETEKALQRAHKEIASLEKRYPEYTPPAHANEPEQETTQSITDMGMHEMEVISVDNLLFDPLQDLWQTLTETPESNLSELVLEEGNLPPPNNELWYRLVMGDNEYSLLISIHTALAETLSSAIVKEETEKPLHACLEQLGQTIAQALVNDMTNTQISTEEFITQATAIKHLESQKVVTEILATCEDKPIYAVLTACDQE
jgi:small-conductance mechanosensitive channel